MSNRIGIIAGSLRKASLSKKLARAVVDLQPEGFEFEILSIDNLPIYNQDFDDFNEVPESYTEFRTKLKDIEGFIFITPEYNRSIPGVLKNAIDVGSRPAGASVWDSKPAAVFSSSPGNLSAFGANHHLRQCFVYLNLPTMQQPEVYIANVTEWFDDNGNIKSEDNRKFLKSAIDAYAEWFKKTKGNQ
ncbi:NAD(P)H-dependent oxidoreductase [Chryseobacterium sp. SN22]|uniref:NADPH-dependent FMN reductase n=1 Tax=Chryseobacterium sp. SN22 TaxID=2606431 RepID=UPI0011EC3C86|nr:NAD(P)H-dependent oxidoreductase [Chryseobacterium sp. SN22]KAA0129331.1 NAD(P)H-dependent oxidoreductase [Chryseobacterium sp. SN22]